MFDIEFTTSGLEDLKSLKKNEQRRILKAIDGQLQHQPNAETRNRKRLRPNTTARWELRSGQFRVFYNVDEENSVVSIEAVGIKLGNLLFVRGAEKEL